MTAMSSNLKPGKTVHYEVNCRAGVVTGEGKVHLIEEGQTGTWLILIDYERRKFVTLRPSQVKAVLK